MKKYISITIGIPVFLLAILLLMACTTTQGTITTETHPESKIVHLLDSAGLDAETTGHTIADIVVMEIKLGKFAKAEVVTFIEKRISAIEKGITYYKFVSVLETYGELLLKQKTNQEISNVAMVGYMLMKNRLNYGAIDFDSIKSKIGIIGQDQDIILRLLRYVLSQVKTYA